MSKGIFTIIGVFVIGIAVVITGFFLLDIEKNAINYWAFSSLIFTFIVSMFAMVTIIAPKREKDGVFYSTGLNSAVWIYLIAIVLSILFTRVFGLFRISLNSFIFIQIVINALFFLAAILIITVSGRIYKINAETYEKMQNGENNTPKRGGF